ncbi:MAG: hypothetical protein NC937_00325 [Candidatus Omnitrophica bacterium]|nr:hypothetical protein [Candidatus Omnitrophota bacterium]
MKLNLTKLFILCVFLVLPLRASEFPLKDFSFDAYLDISGTWLFKMDSADTGVKDSWYQKDLDRSNWEKISVPGVWNKKPGEISYPCPEGVGWYFCAVTVPSNWKQEVLIVFLGSMYTTDVWIDGNYAGVHRGGYTPFMMDITKLVSPGKKITIVVRVDNRRGRTIPSSGMGWHPFGGIYREVFLIHRKHLHFDSVATSTVLKGNYALFNLDVDLVNNSKTNFNGEVLLQLKDKQKIAALQKAFVNVASNQKKRINFSLKLNNAKLWSPESPYLYTVKLSLPDFSKIEFQVGIRQFESKNGNLYLNGKRIWLQGFGNHEEFPNYGPCVDEEKLKKDLLLMKNVYKANAFRTGHYPFHPSLFDLCDKLGIIVHTEIPAWQVNKDFMQSDEAWNLWLKPQLEEMVKTFRNHACIAFWGLSNELYNVPLYHKKAAEFVRSLDKDRFITIVCASTSDLESNSIADIVARNFHYGWYHSKSVYALRDNLGVVLKSSEGKPIWVAEIGALANAGNYSGGYGDLLRGTEKYQDKGIRYGVQYCATQTDQICGISVWTFSDFHGRGQFIAHGILDEYRKPKISGYTICNLFNGNVRIFICEEETLVKQAENFVASIRTFNPDEKKYRNLEVNWCIIKNQKKVKFGNFRFSVDGERHKEIGKIEFAPPDEPGLYSLWVQLVDSKGNWLYTNSCFFDVKQASNPGILKVIINGNYENVKMVYQDIQIPAYPHTGIILPFEPGNYTFEFRTPGYNSVIKDVVIEQGRLTEIAIDFKK